MGGGEEAKPALEESSADGKAADEPEAKADAKAKASTETPKAEPVEEPDEEPVEEAAETKGPKADPEVKTAEATETAEPKSAEPKAAESDAEAAVSDEEDPPVLAEPLPITDAWYEAARSTYSFTRDQTGAWTKRFEFGGTWVEGNSNTSEGYVGGIFERKFDRVFYQIDWNGRHSTADEEVTQSRWNINGTTDFSRYEEAKWILFMSHKHLFDQLADLNYRGTFASGIGYRFYNEDEKRLIARIGPGTTVEKYDPPIGTRTTFDAFAEIEAKWPILDRTHLEYKSTFTPSVEDLGVFRVVSKYGLLIALDESKAWAMKLGLRHDMNSKPNPGLKKNDFTTTFSVVYSRK